MAIKKSPARRPVAGKTKKGVGITPRQLRLMSGGADEYIVMCLTINEANRVHNLLYPHLPPSPYRAGLPGAPKRRATRSKAGS